jgi:serine/threonine protein kinase
MESHLPAEGLDELYDEAPCGYLSVLPGGAIARVNRTFLSWTGYTAEELYTSRRFSTLLTMPAALLYETHCVPLIRLQGFISEIALDIRCRDGNPLPVLLSAAAKRDAAGELRTLRLVIMNAPRRREYERELVRARTAAEEVAEEVRILRELAERKVVEQQRLLDAVARMAAGDLETAVPFVESSSLAQTIDRMRDAIRAQIRELKERHTEVAQLNIELRHQIEQRSRLIIDRMEAEQSSASSDASGVGETEAQSLLPRGAILDERYRIEGLIGQGAMGNVYEVERISNGRRLAAKVLSIKPDFHAMMRFAREAQLLARLQHPNLLAILDVDISDDRRAYIIMDLVRGRSLAELSGQYGDPDFMLPFLQQIADALTTVHGAGVVHRDLKPTNVLIASATGAMQAKLVDFGVSRLLDNSQDSPTTLAMPTTGEYAALIAENIGVLSRTLDAPLHAASTYDLPEPSNELTPPSGSSVTSPASSSSSSVRRRRSSDELTQFGALLGTPHYMAPELCHGASLARPPADIFSFGVMAYEVLTGSLPFAEPPPLLFARGVSTLTFAPIDSLCQRLKPELARFLERCLEIEPARRPNAEEVLRALTRVHPESDTVAIR